MCQGRGEGGNEKLRCVCFGNEYQECRDHWAGCYFSKVTCQTDCLHLRLLNSIHQPIRSQMHVALTNQRSGLLGSPGLMCECWHWVDMEVWGVMTILTVNTALPGPRLVRCQHPWPLIGWSLCLSHGSLECIHGPRIVMERGVISSQIETTAQSLEISAWHAACYVVSFLLNQRQLGRSDIIEKDNQLKTQNLLLNQRTGKTAHSKQVPCTA